MIVHLSCKPFAAIDKLWNHLLSYSIQPRVRHSHNSKNTSQNDDHLTKHNATSKILSRISPRGIEIVIIGSKETLNPQKAVLHSLCDTLCQNEVR